MSELRELRSWARASILLVFFCVTAKVSANQGDGYWGPELFQWQVCKTHADCVLVEDAFVCPCGMLSVNKNALPAFDAKSALMKAYWKGRPPEVLCEPCAQIDQKKLRPRCRASACVPEAMP
jgi:hypothetical protein